MPAYVARPHAASIGLVPGYFGGHMLGAQHNPFETGDPERGELPGAEPEPRQRADARAAGRPPLAADPLRQRRRRTLDAHPTAQAMDRFGREAFEFVTGPAAREAFDIGKEDAQLRDRYGRNNWGQATLLARRLVEAGSTFVTVHFGGWDHHWDLKAGYENYLPKVDAAVAALFDDLDDRGLLDTTLVVLCGEFSRTPKMNDGGNGGPPVSMGTPGRDHWGNAMFCLMGGGGVKGGQVVGSTDRLGQTPAHARGDAVEHPRHDLPRAWASTRSCNCSTRPAAP